MQLSLKYSHVCSLHGKVHNFICHSYYRSWVSANTGHFHQFAVVSCYATQNFEHGKFVFMCTRNWFYHLEIFYNKDIKHWLQKTQVENYMAGCEPLSSQTTGASFFRVCSPHAHSNTFHCVCHLRYHSKGKCAGPKFESFMAKFT